MPRWRGSFDSRTSCALLTTLTPPGVTDSHLSIQFNMSNNIQTAELEMRDVIGLSTNNKPLSDFLAMWYRVFLWALFSSIIVHFVAAAIAFGCLRKHSYGRFIPGIILMMGILSPLTGGVITSAAIACVYHASGFTMDALYALVWGVGQTIIIIFISFTRILATL